jgi:hypothetical protein
MDNNINKFLQNIIQVYNKTPKAIEIVLNYKLINTPLDTVDSTGNNLVHHMVLKNDERTLVELLNYFVYNSSLTGKKMLNAQNNDGDTPMHIAVRNSNEKIAKMLDDAGTNKRIKNKKGEFIESSEDEKQDSINLSLLNDSEIYVNSSKHHKCKKSMNSSENLSDSERFINRLKKELGLKRNINSKNIDETLDEMSKIKKQLNIVKSYVINNSSGMIGGNNDSSTFDIDFVDVDENIQLGGARRVNKRSTASTNSDSSRSDKTPKESSQIHDQVVKNFINLKFSEEDARALKSGLYNLVKEKHPNESNLEKAKLMLKYLNDKEVVEMLKNKVDELKAIIKKARELKEKQLKGAKKSKTDSESLSLSESESEKKPKAKAKAKSKATASAQL